MIWCPIGTKRANTLRSLSRQVVSATRAAPLASIASGRVAWGRVVFSAAVLPVATGVTVTAPVILVVSALVSEGWERKRRRKTRRRRKRSPNNKWNGYVGSSLASNNGGSSYSTASVILVVSTGWRKTRRKRSPNNKWNWNANDMKGEEIKWTKPNHKFGIPNYWKRCHILIGNTGWVFVALRYDTIRYAYCIASYLIVLHRIVVQHTGDSF